MKRRNFLQLAGASAALALFHGHSTAAPAGNHRKVHAITGTWFEFQHHSEVEGTYWNPALAAFTADDWEAKVAEIAGTGIRYLVLLDVAIYGKSFYPSALLPQHALTDNDPLETVLSATDKHQLRVFMSNGFFGDWRNPAFLMQDKDIHLLRVRAMEELTGKYGHHPSFYGWYYPNETGINGHFDDNFIQYVNKCSLEAHRLTPRAKTLIAPYGTRNVAADDGYVAQLDRLDVDFIAYQDEIGVQKTRVDESTAIFEKLHRLHRKSGRNELWADVEVFAFEGEVYRSALLPAAPERVLAQLGALAELVEQVFIYQYTGMINRPGSPVTIGYRGQHDLYTALTEAGWLKRR
ncbi:DUF4434 domain-containing protein [Parapedobacter lycopersici]|uniref:DUF4434 domain-containing protein n=1 Tax=Parapedobacter lycopersici TaxID=1864939 RepID=UPI00214D6DB3|nr:DUF4434 domain-containing protein [Parapedobacter lycopersici]